MPALSVNQCFRKVFESERVVESSKLVKFIKSEFNLGYSDQKLLGMIRLFYQADTLDMVDISNISLVYREHVEVSIPLHHFITIIINAAIEIENSMNVILEKVFHKYSHWVTSVKEPTGFLRGTKNTEQDIIGIGRMGFFNLAKDSGWKLSELKLEIIFNEKIKSIKKKYLDLDSFIDLMKEAKIVNDINDFHIDDKKKNHSVEERKKIFIERQNQKEIISDSEELSNQSTDRVLEVKKRDLENEKRHSKYILPKLNMFNFKDHKLT